MDSKKFKPHVKALIRDVSNKPDKGKTIRDHLGELECANMQEIKKVRGEANTWGISVVSLLRTIKSVSKAEQQVAVAAHVLGNNRARAQYADMTELDMSKKAHKAHA